MIRLLIITLFISIDLLALPFNDDMVHEQIKIGELSRPRVENTIPQGTKEYNITKEEALNLEKTVDADLYSITRGNRLFMSNCSACHGDISSDKYETPAAGKLMGAPNLSDAFYHDRSENSIFATIRYGNLIMPALGWKLSIDETWDIVNYVLSVQERTSEKVE